MPQPPPPLPCPSRPPRPLRLQRLLLPVLSSFPASGYRPRDVDDATPWRLAAARSTPDRELRGGPGSGAMHGRLRSASSSSPTRSPHVRSPPPLHGDERQGHVGAAHGVGGVRAGSTLLRPLLLLRGGLEMGRGGASSFLLPLHPKPKAAGVKVDSTMAVLPERQYYTSVDTGNPARPYFLGIDTGSALTWIQCDAPCTNCTKGPHPLYKPAKENIVPPRDSHCRELQGNQNYSELCDYEIAYTDRSSSAGVLAMDNMQLITADGERENMDFVFGCAHDQQGKLLDLPVSTDGILGHSNGALSLTT
ncbi:hypothetical protein ACQJBY_014835 [Aegilops geniculata]